MSDTKYVAVKYGTHRYKKDNIFLIIYTSYNNFEKNGGKICWILLQETDWLIGYFRRTRLSYSQRIEDVSKTLICVTEAYFLPSFNKALNTKTLKTKMLPLKLFTNQKEVICVAIRREAILNLLEDSLILSICAQGFSLSEITYSATFQD